MQKPMKFNNKSLNFSGEMVALILGSLLLFSTSSFADTQVSLYDNVVNKAERGVKAYAQSKGWVNFDYEVDAWIPGGKDRKETCNSGFSAEPTRETRRDWGRVPFSLSCEQPTWQLRARADISLTVPVVVAKRNISRDEPLSYRTMKLSSRDVGRIYGDFVTDMRQLSGKRARRSLRADQVITLSHAAAPMMVERNDRIMIKVDSNGIEASMAGMALEDGTKGEGIRVRNISSGKVITAWVSGRGTVETRF